MPHEQQHDGLRLRGGAFERLARSVERLHGHDLEGRGAVSEQKVAPAREMLRMRLDEQDEWPIHYCPSLRAVCRAGTARRRWLAQARTCDAVGSLMLGFFVFDRLRDTLAEAI